MKSLILGAFLIIIVVINPYSFCLAEENKEVGQEVKGFSLVQFEEGGDKKWELSGKSAEVENNKIKIEEVSAITFGERTSLKLKARKGDFDRDKGFVELKNNVVAKTTNGTRLLTDSLYWDAGTKNVFTDASVNIKKADFEVSGKGAVCDLEGNTAELKKDVKANIKSSEPSRLLRTPNGSTSSPSLEPSRAKSRDSELLTTISCDGPLEINYNKNRATFLNNVKVTDTQGNIFANRIDVYFNQDTRRIRCVVCRGDVKIVNGESVTYSEKAIYLVDEGRVVLPRRPRLVIQGE